MTTQPACCAYCHLPVPRAPADRTGPVYCCLGCRFAAAVVEEGGETGRIRWTLTRLALAIFFSMNVMMCAMALWSRDFGPFPEAASSPAHTRLQDAFTGLLQWACLALTLPVVALLGIPLAVQVVDQLRTRRLTTDAFLMAGVLASFGYSVLALVRGQGPLYFEVTCMVLVAVTLGRWLEAIAKQKTTAAIDTLGRLLPDRVERIGKSGIEEVPLADVRVGDRLRWAPGRRFGVDSRIIEGRALVDRSVLTGESQPVHVGPGDLVEAGTVNLDGVLIARAVRPPGEGAFARLVALVERAAHSKSPYQKLADRLAAVFLPAVLLLATGVWIGRTLTSDGPTAVQHALSVVLIACPCALGLATPLAVWSALGHAATRHVLIRDGDQLCRLADVDTVVFDKTGTLTRPQAQVRQAVVAEASEASVRQLAGWLCAASDHPHAQAVRRWHGEPTRSGTGGTVRAVAGRGLEGSRSGTTYRLGHPGWFEHDAFGWPDALRRARRAMESRGSAVSVLGWNRRVHAVLEISETPRPEVEDVLAALRAEGLELLVLSGDSPERARATCAPWNVAWQAGLLPEDKTRIVQELRQSGKTIAMVGDGLNDAPALAAADVGIAVGTASDLTRQNAGVCLIGRHLGGVVEAIRIARQTRRAVRFNLFWAFAYNTIGVGLATAGLLHPIVSAVAMIGSSILVVGRSLALRST